VSPAPLRVPARGLRRALSKGRCFVTIAQFIRSRQSSVLVNAAYDPFIDPLLDAAAQNERERHELRAQLQDANARLVTIAALLKQIKTTHQRRSHAETSRVIRDACHVITAPPSTPQH